MNSVCPLSLVSNRIRQWFTRRSRSIDLGPVEQVRVLFSYPNNCNEIKFIDQSLEETIAHYLKQSLQRDMYEDTNLKVYQKRGRVLVSMDGADTGAIQSYSSSLPEFLSIGWKAYQSSLQVHADGKWRYNWRFFLPLGLAIANDDACLQLMHFPPDYILMETQDHLLARTVRRWQTILEENDDEERTSQMILDILPIAAPSRDGTLFAGVYNYYHEYILAMMQFMTRKNRRPVVAFGRPVSQWVQSVSGTTNLNVLDVVELNIPGPNGLNIPDPNGQEYSSLPVLIANHPSYFYNAVERSQLPVDKLRKILAQDLIVGRWQVKMEKNPLADPRRVLRECKRHWEENSSRIDFLLLEATAEGRVTAKD